MSCPGLPRAEEAQSEYPAPSAAALLVAACLRGEDDALARFVNEYQPVVHRAVVRRLASLSGVPPVRAEAEDLTSEVLERLFADGCRRMKALRNPDAICGWLVALARNHVTDHLRKLTSRDRAETALGAEPAAAPATPVDCAIAKERRGLVLETLGRLGAQDRMIIKLYFVHGMQYAQIAGLMGMNINTVATRLRRAKAKLQPLLATLATEGGNRP